ncbi:hypothetical protein K9N68_23155 [Kovacikia minuta CCNUW1]|uniref:hypothetical protein n=1 Tax=Kovacikia minuta TaxID=2931930 RepID=UPI001CC9B1AA|nr:hypothetical protein [Kovacikia minuta]UBF29749.1 hypothetical protein K9N68_23155 [Kovacikia minuta CCNUW1]
MNIKKIVFSGIVTGAVGTGLGLVMLALAPVPYTGKPYQNLERTYVVIGGIAGLLIGSSQETIRQLKKQRDQEEAIADQLRQAKNNFMQLNPDQAHRIKHVEQDLR